jgi:hypothetical protein
MAYAVHEESGDTLCPACIKAEQPTVWDNFYDKGQFATTLVDKVIDDDLVTTYKGKQVPDTWDGHWFCYPTNVVESHSMMICSHCNKELDMVTILHVDAEDLEWYGVARCECEDCLPRVAAE